MNHNVAHGRPSLPTGVLRNVLAAVALLAGSAAAFALPPGATLIPNTPVVQTQMEFCQSKFLARLAACQQIGVLPADPYSDAALTYAEPNCAAAAQAKYENCLTKSMTVR